MSDTPKTDDFEWSMANKLLTGREVEILRFARGLEKRAAKAEKELLELDEHLNNVRTGLLDERDALRADLDKALARLLEAKGEA